MYLLFYHNKCGEQIYFNKRVDMDVWYDCHDIAQACKFPNRSDAESAKRELNAISRRKKWYGMYRLKRIA